MSVYQTEVTVAYPAGVPPCDVCGTAGNVSCYLNSDLDLPPRLTSSVVCRLQDEAARVADHSADFHTPW